MREKEIEKMLVNAVKIHGGLALKFVSPNFNGMPDRLILLPFGKIVFTPDECNIVRNSLQKDGVEKKTRENIISCLSSISGIGNLYYACSQAFPVALDRGDINAIQASNSISAGFNSNPGFCALMGKTNFLFADFSQHTFTQTHYIVKAEINEAGNDFNIANFIYRTYGEDYIHNDSVDDSLNERSAEDYRFLDDSLLPENDFRNRRRNFSGNIAIATYK